MTYDQLKVLDAVVRAGSFKGASEILHRTQPAISQAIKNLEQEFGVQLFSREKYRPCLTPEGEKFFHNARMVLSQTERLEALGHEMGMGQEAEVGIALDSLCPMPAVLKTCEEIISRFSDTKFQLMAEYWSGSMERLLNRDVDIAIAPLLDEPVYQLEAVPLMSVILTPVAAPQFAAAKVEHELNKEEICRYVHVLVQDSARRTLSQRLKNLLDVGNTWLVSDHATKKEILLAGLGWGRLPEHLISQELETRQLVPIRNRYLKRERFIIHLIRKNDRPIGPVTRKLWDALLSTAESFT